MKNKIKAVLAANNAFYRAFAEADYPAMESLWARDHDIAVIHPGWEPLHGRLLVLDSLRRILANPIYSSMYCSDVKPYIMDTAAFIVCTENLPEGKLVGTNIFVLEDGDWKMVHHQSGPIPEVIHDVPSSSLH